MDHFTKLYKYFINLVVWKQKLIVRMCFTSRVLSDSSDDRFVFQSYFLKAFLHSFGIERYLVETIAELSHKTRKTNHFKQYQLAFKLYN